MFFKAVERQNIFGVGARLLRTNKEILAFIKRTRPVSRVFTSLHAFHILALNLRKAFSHVPIAALVYKTGRPV